MKASWWTYSSDRYDFCGSRLLKLNKLFIKIWNLSKCMLRCVSRLNENLRMIKAWIKGFKLQKENRFWTSYSFGYGLKYRQFPKERILSLRYMWMSKVCYLSIFLQMAKPVMLRIAINSLSEKVKPAFPMKIRKHSQSEMPFSLW